MRPHPSAPQNIISAAGCTELGAHPSGCARKGGPVGGRTDGTHHMEVTDRNGRCHGRWARARCGMSVVVAGDVADEACLAKGCRLFGRVPSRRTFPRDFCSSRPGIILYEFLSHGARRCWRDRTAGAARLGAYSGHNFLEQCRCAKAAKSRTLATKAVPLRQRCIRPRASWRGRTHFRHGPAIHAPVQWSPAPQGPQC